MPDQHAHEDPVDSDFEFRIADAIAKTMRDDPEAFGLRTMLDEQLVWGFRCHIAEAHPELVTLVDAILLEPVVSVSRLGVPYGRDGGDLDRALKQLLALANAWAAAPLAQRDECSKVHFVAPPRPLFSRSMRETKLKIRLYKSASMATRRPWIESAMNIRPHLPRIRWLPLLLALTGLLFGLTLWYLIRAGAERTQAIRSLAPRLQLDSQSATRTNSTPNSVTSVEAQTPRSSGSNVSLGISPKHEFVAVRFNESQSLQVLLSAIQPIMGIRPCGRMGAFLLYYPGVADSTSLRDAAGHDPRVVETQLWKVGEDFEPHYRRDRSPGQADPSACLFEYAGSGLPGTSGAPNWPEDRMPTVKQPLPMRVAFPSQDLSIVLALLEKLEHVQICAHRRFDEAEGSTQSSLSRRAGGQPSAAVRSDLEEWRAGRWEWSAADAVGLVIRIRSYSRPIEDAFEASGMRLNFQPLGPGEAPRTCSPISMYFSKQGPGRTLAPYR